MLPSKLFILLLINIGDSSMILSISLTDAMILEI